jgi:hypothetical protein
MHCCQRSHTPYIFCTSSCSPKSLPNEEITPSRTGDRRRRKDHPSGSQCSRWTWSMGRQSPAERRSSVLVSLQTAMSHIILQVVQPGRVRHDQLIKRPAGAPPLTKKIDVGDTHAQCARCGKGKPQRSGRHSPGRGWGCSRAARIAQQQPSSAKTRAWQTGESDT